MSFTPEGIFPLRPIISDVEEPEEKKEEGLASIHPSGTVIGDKYEVVEGPREKKHYQGGMGLVYFCKDTGLDRPVALKTLQPQFLDNPKIHDRFLREATLWMELEQHPYIVQAYDLKRIRTDGRETYLVLEYIAPGPAKVGASLREWLRPGPSPLPMVQSLTWMWEIANGMTHAVEKQPGFVHRDLKPENILVGHDGHARITDLGLAKCVTLDTLPSEAKFLEEPQATSDHFAFQRTSLTQHAIGTPMYMAPEQWHGNTEPDARTDIYAWGCILLELLSGHWPVPGKTKEELKQGHVTGQVGLATKALPAGIQEMVRRCVAVIQADRYASWSELLKGFEKGFSTWTGSPLPMLPSPQEVEATQNFTLGWALNALGNCYVDIGKAKVAVKYYEKVISLSERESEREYDQDLWAFTRYFKDWAQDLRATALASLGRAYATLEDPKRAIRFYTDCMRLKNVANWIQLHNLNNLAGTYTKIGKPQQAIPLFEHLLPLVRDSSNRTLEGTVLMNLAVSHRMLGEFQRAIPIFEQSLAMARAESDRKAEAQILENLAETYFELGEPQQAIPLFEHLLPLVRDSSNRTLEGTVLMNLAVSHRMLGEFQRAIPIFEQSLAMVRAERDRKAEAQILENLAEVYMAMGEFQRAISLFEESLAIARTMGDRTALGRALSNLARAYMAMGQFQQAIFLFEESLAIARTMGDRMALGRALPYFAKAYIAMGQSQQAILLHEESLAIARTMGDRMGEKDALNNLGQAYMDLGESQQAISLHEESLAIARTMGDRMALGRALCNLGLAYTDLGKPQQAILLHEESLAIARTMGDRMGEKDALNNLGQAYTIVEEYNQAIPLFEESLAIARTMGDQMGEGRALGNLGGVFVGLGEFQQAITFLQQRLVVAKAIGDQKGEGISLGNLGIAFGGLGNLKQAITFHEQHLTIAQAIGDQAGEERALGNLDVAYRALGNPQLSIDCRPTSATQRIPDSQNSTILTFHQNGDYSQVLEILFAGQTSPSTPNDNSDIDSLTREALISQHTNTLASNPSDAETYIRRGKVYKDMGRLQEADQDFTEAIEWDPMHAAGYFERGKLYEQKKAFQAALEDYAQAVSLSSNIPEYQFALGSIYYRLGALEQAMKPLTNASDQGHSIAPLLLKLLQPD